MERPLRSALSLIFVSSTLAACGGGGDADNVNAPAPAVSIASIETNGPAANGDTAVDGFNWFNFRRAQAGLQPVSRNSLVDVAAKGHSEYQTLWGITHYQTEGKTGFTGVCVYDNAEDPLCDPAKVSRLEAARYNFTPGNGYAFGEVISATSYTSGFDAAEGLVTAIYHRFVILEPMFKQAGVGAATSTAGRTYFTTNFVADGLDIACADRGRVVTYPFAGQQQVQRNFYSNTELPDPVPDRDEVGYPVSVHADIIASISTLGFTIRPRGGAPLQVRTLTASLDEHTPSTAAAIVPLSPLAANTTYDVQFDGIVSYAGTEQCPVLSKPVSLSWSFTTR